ncbi:MAG: CHAT domain-containing protein [Alphaproteobacteria bacterium]
MGALRPSRRWALGAAIAAALTPPSAWAQQRPRSPAQIKSDQAQAILDADKANGFRNDSTNELRARALAREGVAIAQQAQDLPGLLDSAFVLGHAQLLLNTADDHTGAEDTLAVLTKVVNALYPRFPDFTEQMAWMAASLSYALGRDEANNPVRMRETRRLLALCAKRYAAVSDYHALDAGSAMALGDWAGARRAAEATFATELVNRKGDKFHNAMTALETAAIAAAHTGDWPSAWRYLERARAASPAAVDAAPPLEDLERIFETTDAIVVLACADAGAQIWLATRQSGLRGARAFDIPNFNRFRRDTSLYGDYWAAATRNSRFRGFWGGYMRVDKKDAAAGESDDFHRMLAIFGPYWRSFLGDALDTAFDSARAFGAKRVLWAPHAEFTIVPIVAMANAAGRYLGEGMAVKQAHSLRDCLPPPRPQATRYAARVIAPAENVDIPMARIEGEVVKRALPPAPGADIVIHAATHAGFSEKGTIIKGENGQIISIAQFATLYFPNQHPRLVVLSACESGFDVPYGHDSILAFPPRLILGLGAEAVVASLWSVDDAATFFLMSRTYKSIADGATPDLAFGLARTWLSRARRADLTAHANALRAANLVTPADVGVINDTIAAYPGDPPFAKPQYWAAWIYFGK